MKTKKKQFDIFNISFLDVISCGFGAVVILILISKPDVSILISGKDMVTDLLSQFLALETAVESASNQVEERQRERAALLRRNALLRGQSAELSKKLEEKQEANEGLKESLQGLALVESTLKRATIRPSTNNLTRDEEVGGIPVDSDYVIFVIDTSGSMREIWPRVTREINNVLSIHPQVKGFQILSDVGKPLMSTYSGRWIPDTPQRRKAVLDLFSSWRVTSKSNPVGGIETALKIYAKKATTASIYVFGDDYTGSSYDPVIDRITRLNKTADGRLARIHAIGFISPSTYDRFAILMRELTKRNDGTLVALPR